MKAALYYLLAAGCLVVAANFFIYKSEGNDFYARWNGTRALFHGGDPYRAETTRQNQLHRYGRVLSDDEIRAHRDQERFAYPLYVSFLVGPLALLDFAKAQHIIWMLLVVCLFLSVPLWASAIGWQASRRLLVVIGTVFVFSPIGRRGLDLTQLAFMVAFLLAAAVWCATRGCFTGAGFLLAMSTIKPQMAALPALWLLLWGLARWKERKWLVLGFALTLSLLVAISLVLVPTWPNEFLSGLWFYRSYTSAPSAFDAIFGARFSLLLSYPLLLLLLSRIWRWRNTPCRFGLSCALVFCATAWLMPAMWDPFNQVLMLPAICLLGAHRQPKNVHAPPPPLAGGVAIVMENAWSAEPKALVARKVKL